MKTVPSLRTSPLPAALARLGVGAAALVEAFEVGTALRALSDPRLLKVPRFEGFPTIPPAGIGLFLAIWLVVAASFCVGWRTRPAGTLLAGFIGYILLLDRQLYSNHLYLMLILTLLLTLADSGAALSLDSRRRGTTPTIPAWPVILLRLQVTVVYAFAAATKLNLVYLSGLVLRTQLRLPGLESVPAPLFALAAIASVLTELFLALALWNRRLRPIAFLVGTGFHLTILLTMRVLPDLLIFALLMVSAYLAFFGKIAAPCAVAPRRISVRRQLAPRAPSGQPCAGTAAAATPARSRCRPG